MKTFSFPEGFFTGKTKIEFPKGYTMCAIGQYELPEDALEVVPINGQAEFFMNSNQMFLVPCRENGCPKHLDNVYMETGEVIYL